MPVFYFLFLTILLLTDISCVHLCFPFFLGRWGRGALVCFSFIALKKKFTASDVLLYLLYAAMFLTSSIINFFIYSSILATADRVGLCANTFTVDK